MDLHNLLHFLALRLDPHAQQEIRAYAGVIGEQVVARWVPLVWEAFVDYRLEARSLSRLDRALLGALGRGEPDTAAQLARDAGWLGVSAKTGRLKRSRERAEFEAKAAELGLTPPWLASTGDDPAGDQAGG